jgi:acylphosphatase
MLVARRILVRGRVQGVGFRFFIREAAQIENLSGWVANRADGQVEVAVEGDLAAVERFERRVAAGPPGARVDDVQASTEAPAGRMVGFDIRS